MDKQHHNDEAARDGHARPDKDTQAPDELRRRGFPPRLRLLFLAVVLGVALVRHFQGAG